MTGAWSQTPGLVSAEREEQKDAIIVSSLPNVYVSALKKKKKRVYNLITGTLPQGSVFFSHLISIMHASIVAKIYSLLL